MKSTLAKAGLRWSLRHPWQTWLALLGIALGVAVMVAVDLANATAKRAFALSLEQVSGPATHRIEAAAGAIDEQIYARLRSRLPGEATPLIEATVAIGDTAFTLLGVDAFTQFNRSDAWRFDGDGLLDLLVQPATLAMSRRDAERLALVRGDPVQLSVPGAAREAQVALLVDAERGSGLDGLLICDMATAQELLGRVGTIDRIDLRLPQGREGEVAALLPEGLRLVAAERRGQVMEGLTRAFHLNLTAMGLLAVLIGGFIIYNAIWFSVIQRRALLGTLRMLGVTRGELFRLVLGEALVLSLLGGALGLLAGVAAATLLVDLVARTINDLYFTLRVGAVAPLPGPLIKGLLIGVAVTLLAALGPALEAARSEPRDVIRRSLIDQRGARLLPWLLGLALLLCLLGVGLLALPSRSLGLGFASLFTLIAGLSLVVPVALLGIMRVAEPVFQRLFGTVGRLAVRGVSGSISRTGLAVAALTVAISATIGVGVMITSLRLSVVEWLGTTLTSDVYVSAVSASGVAGAGDLPAGIDQVLGGIDGVVDVTKGRRRSVETNLGQLEVLALEASYGAPRGFILLAGDEPGLWPRFLRGEGVLVSEPLANHFGVAVGDSLRLFTTSGWRDMPVAAVFVDYGADRGLIVVPLAHYAPWWGDDGISAVGLVVADDADPVVVAERARVLMSGAGAPFQVRENRAIREHSLEVFDRTFTITQVLRLLAIGVAFIGVLSALMALELERARDYAVLRASGMTRAQLARLILLKTSIIGLVAGLLALPLGLLMAWMLIDVVNLRSFGWTMIMQPTPAPLIGGVLLAWLAALLAGVVPALRAARVQPAVALRGE